MRSAMTFTTAYLRDTMTLAQVSPGTILPILEYHINNCHRALLNMGEMENTIGR